MNNYQNFQQLINDENIGATENDKNQLDIFLLANAFLSIESMTQKKLQKLCYYAQAWYLALYNQRLVDARFEAWVHGAVQPDLYQKYKAYGFQPIPKVTNLQGIPEDFISFSKVIYEAYGKYDGMQLEALNHQEEPWIKARGSLPVWANCENAILEEDMKMYYRQKL